MNNTILDEIISRIDNGLDVTLEEVISAKNFNKQRKANLAASSKKFAEQIAHAEESLDSALVNLNEQGFTQLTLDGRDYSTSLVDKVSTVLTGDKDALIAELKAHYPLFVVTTETVDTKALLKAAASNKDINDITSRYFTTTTQVQAKISNKKAKEVK